MDAARFGSALYAGAACVAQVFHQELVHAEQRLTLVGHYAAVLIEHPVCSHFQALVVEFQLVGYGLRRLCYRLLVCHNIGFTGR